MDSRTRATLLEEIRDGKDPLAWDEFFRRYGPLVFSYARARGCSENTAEDIVQDVMLKVFEGRDVFRYDPARGRFRDWLGAVVRNRVAEWRRRPAGRARAADVSETAAEEPAPEAEWEDAFEKELLVALLEIVRCEVNPRNYSAFELLVLHELPASRVAPIVGLTRNGVYKAARRVLARLKKLSGGYARGGTLPRDLREALRARPAPGVERSLTDRIDKTMRSRWESSRRD